MIVNRTRQLSAGTCKSSSASWTAFGGSSGGLADVQMLDVDAPPLGLVCQGHQLADGGSRHQAAAIRDPWSHGNASSPF
jgi:hypothetical protein